MPTIHRRKANTYDPANSFNKGVVIPGVSDGYTVDEDFEDFGTYNDTIAAGRFDDSTIDHIGERWNGGKRTRGGIE